MRALLVLLTATAVTMFVAPAYADSGRGGEGNGGRTNANKEINAAARNDREHIRSIETEDDYWSAVDDTLHMGVTVANSINENQTIDEKHLESKWGKNFERLERERQKLDCCD